jgi:hypothetical protein
MPTRQSDSLAIFSHPIPRNRIIFRLVGKRFCDSLQFGMHVSCRITVWSEARDWYARARNFAYRCIPTWPYIPRNFTRPSHLSIDATRNLEFYSSGSVSRVGSIPIARSKTPKYEGQRETTKTLVTMQVTRERNSFKRAVLEAAISIEMTGAARGNITEVPAPQTSEDRIHSNELQKGRGQRWRAAWFNEN